KVYRNSAYFVAWMDKPALIQRINAMPPERRTWTFEGAKRDFWNCKIRDAKAPGTLIGYLKQLPVVLK
ncbi:MAG: hypothetical protein LBS07_02910, partial [Prevotellaceae bacterium]|nr:hypothetical protein [Prevotellaceae bacterium]